MDALAGTPPPTPVPDTEVAAPALGLETAAEVQHAAGAGSVSTWRRLFRTQLNRTSYLLATLLSTIGALTLALALLVATDQLQQVLVEVAVSLLLFGGTSLFLTYAVSSSLDRSLELSITEILRDHSRSIKQLTSDTQTAVRETAEQIKPLGGNWRDLGLTDVYLTRSDALAAFDTPIRVELQSASRDKPASEEQLAEETSKDESPVAGTGSRTERSSDRGRLDNSRSTDRHRSGPPSGPKDQQEGSNRCRLWIAASSMKGLLETASANFDGRGRFTWAAELARVGKLDLRILMTHPFFARMRADQESRGARAIPEEIEEALNLLRTFGVPAQRVRLVTTPPTVFAIATRDQMLLNPYPYSQEAYRSFTFTVRRSHPEPSDHQAIHRDIFEQYMERHFIRPWKNQETVSLSEAYEIPKETYQKLAERYTRQESAEGTEPTPGTLASERPNICDLGPTTTPSSVITS